MTTTSDIKATTLVFLHDTLTPISGRPNYTTVSMLKRQLYANGYSNACTLGGGLYGYLGLIMPAAEYRELKDAVAWTIPPAPEAAAVSDDDKKKHKQLLVNIRTMDACLKKQLLAAVEHVYLLDIEKEFTGFNSSTAAGILDYLTTQYTIIDYDDLQANRKILDEPWDFTEPIQLLWNRIDTCQRFAKAGGAEIPDSTAIAATYNVLKKTGVFPIQSAFWCHKPSAECTMIAFRILFGDADRQRDNTTENNRMEGVQARNTPVKPAPELNPVMCDMPCGTTCVEGAAP